MNKKGFTLIELLSVIVLIGVILSIGILLVGSIRSSVLDRQYENIIMQINAAGEKYYFDTESTKFYVQTLIDEGYLKTDNESKTIINPKTGEILNCYVVSIDKDTEKATTAKDTGSCDVELEGNYAIYIKQENRDEIDSNKWYDSSFTIKAYKSDTTEDLKNYSWTTDLNPDVIHTGDTYNLVNLLNERGGVINDVFYVSAVNNESGKVLKSGAKRIKIDTVPPKIEDKKISNENKWAKEKTVSITLTDVGSGIKEYVFDTDLNCSSATWTSLDKAQSKVNVSKTFNSNGTYYFCAKDEAGHSLEDTVEFIIEKIDSTPPTCYYDGEETTYSRGTRLIKYGCKDEESGCQKISYGSNNKDCNLANCLIFTQDYTYTGTWSTADIESTIGKFRIVDKVGNYKDCPTPEKNELNIYLDNTAPSVSITGLSYWSEMLYVDVSLYDENSGPNYVEVTFNGRSATEYCYGSCSVPLRVGNISEGTVKVTGYDNVGNSSSDSKVIYKRTGTKSDTRDYDKTINEYIDLNGTTLDYTYNAIVGSVNCDEYGYCTVYPKREEKKCTKYMEPFTTSAEYYDCESGGTLSVWGMCAADNKEYTNETGHCKFEKGKYNGDNFWFDDQCNCSCKYDSKEVVKKRWKDVYIVYECPIGNSNDEFCGQEIESVGVDPTNFKDNGGDICKKIASVSNFGDYTGQKKIYATKTCEYESYEPDTYCPSSGYTKIGTTCYKCDIGKFNKSEINCQYEGICVEYVYKFTYTYYVYN